MRFMICPTLSGCSLIRSLRDPERSLCERPKSHVALKNALCSGKPTITPKTPFSVNDLHGEIAVYRAFLLRVRTVDNCLCAAPAPYNSTAPQKNFSTNER